MLWEHPYDWIRKWSSKKENNMFHVMVLIEMKHYMCYVMVLKGRFFVCNLSNICIWIVTFRCKGVPQLGDLEISLTQEWLISSSCENLSYVIGMKFHLSKQYRYVRN